MLSLFKRLFKNTFFIFLLAVFSCQAQTKSPKTDSTQEQVKNPSKKPILGANQTEAYLPLLKNKNVGIVGNQTSVIFKEDGSFTHLVDSLLARDISVSRVFSPEHGFRGKADAGEKVIDGIDQKTGVPIISLYGNNKKPSPKQLEGLDIIVFDIQDVGVRFYTYISTLHYILEASAEANISVLVLDRPNPNGNYIDGPILEKENKSFVGMHPVPIVHGMTIAEYAQMINGQNWLPNNLTADLMVIPMKNYTKNTVYDLPIKPSPNLPNAKAINLYPSLCFFEGTNVNAGRGTNKQFQIFGSPFLDRDFYSYSYTPKANEGAKNPKHKNELCFGKDLSNAPKLSAINLHWLIEAYQHTNKKEAFFNSFFTKLAGTKKLQKQIENGISEEKIKAGWQKDLTQYDKMRQQYLLYP